MSLINREEPCHATKKAKQKGEKKKKKEKKNNDAELINGNFRINNKRILN